MRGKMDCHGLTHQGKVRADNEDQFLIADLNKSMLIHQTSLSHEDHTRLFGGSQGRLLLVADGMGGQAAGKLASSIAVQALAHYVLNTMPWFFRLQEGQEADMDEELKAAVEECQRRIEADSAAHQERRGMGTTLTMAYLLWPRLFVVHAGDSRCYLYRQGRLEQVTRDHTMAQQMVDQGLLSPEKAEGTRWSHVLWNCIGGGTSDLRTEVHKATLQLGDTLLLCTDGLSKSVPDEQILAVLEKDQGSEETCRQLVGAALAHGGPDNVTVVVARFREAHAVQAAQARQEAARQEPAAAPAAGAKPQTVGAST